MFCLLSVLSVLSVHIIASLARSVGSDGAAFLKDSKRLKIIYQPVREPRSKLAANTHDDGKRNKKQRNNKQPLKDGRIHPFTAHCSQSCTPIVSKQLSSQL